ncbi:hypothetical protein BK120_08395 [Paenibacillus sp. FSL A5-0031]|uniref:GDSL-type esterase/lipase family protein n=1 Tax=Paenibacillus sp. FSL A5-0031 TaxID=1920420 RepID=UPI00096D919E|nr:GDSL-type esterase/lipase family protein [Paenibacillus sp. FSL A5-0031]OME86933.1 hypothetical protein BK120_08395 [Paenibacillus sp. FSL A5-0031]
MSTNKTPNLLLNDWAGPDRVIREEMNVNFRKIDEVVGGHTTQLADTTYGSFIQEDDVSKAKALIENNKSFKFAILGDSTKAGVGWRFGSVDSGYGECGDIDRPTAPEIFFLNLLRGSRYFIKPSAALGGTGVLSKKGSVTTYVSSTATSINWDRYVLTYGVDGQPTSIPLKFKHAPIKRTKIGVYYLARTSDGAAKVDIICNGVTTSIDSYKAPQNFGAVTGISQQGFTLFVAEVTIPSDSDTFDLIVNNVRAGGSPTAGSQGTINIVGFFYGEPPQFKNLSIRATTLKNNTTQNQSKGVTTSERLQKSYAFGANVFYIGWGTNDANLAGTSAAEFGVDLRTRIDEIRQASPGAIIILDSAYPGTQGTYTNVEHFIEAKKVALEKKCSFFDNSNILKKFAVAEVINDYVHPNEYGYKVTGEGMSYLFGISASSEVDAKENSNFLINISAQSTGTVASISAAGGEGDFTNVDINLLTLNFNVLKSNLVVTAKLTLDNPTNMTDTRFLMIANYYTGENQTGTAVQETLDAARFNVVYPTSDAFARQAVVQMLAHKDISSYKSVKITIQGKNYKLSTAGYASKVVATQLD